MSKAHEMTNDPELRGMPEPPPGARWEACRTHDEVGVFLISENGTTIGGGKFNSNVVLSRNAFVRRIEIVAENIIADLQRRHEQDRWLKELLG